MDSEIKETGSIDEVSISEMGKVEDFLNEDQKIELRKELHIKIRKIIDYFEVGKDKEIILSDDIEVSNL